MKKGFSYIEILISLAIFIIVLAAVLPALSQASRNMASAQNTYESQLLAQNLMFIVRDALEAGADPGASAHAYSAERGHFLFTVWIYDTAGNERVIASAKAPAANADKPAIFSGIRTTVIAVVWNDYGGIAGRAVGVK